MDADIAFGMRSYANEGERELQQRKDRAVASARKYQLLVTPKKLSPAENLRMLLERNTR